MKTKSEFSILASLMMMVAFSTFFNDTIHAQQESQTYERTKPSSLYIGMGLSFNDYGLGGYLEVPITELVSLYGNAGLGGWGSKLGAGISFYPSKTPYKSSFSIGYAQASGLQDFATEMSIEPNNQNAQVTLNLNQVGTVNLVYSYNLTLARKSKFALSAGYAIPVTNNAYEIKTSGVTLTQLSEQVIAIMQPGGLIIGFKFLFGVG